VWANDGEDKIVREETRVATSGANSVINNAWNGTTVTVFGAKNETIAFNLNLEAAAKAASNVKVQFNTLTGPSGSTITGQQATGDGVFNYLNRDIELFYVKYLGIHGLSMLGYDNYDERFIPTKLQRPWTGQGAGTGLWTDRPNHDKSYPDIAVPIDLVPTFSIAQGQSQSIWVDVYIPKTAASGVYTGTVTVTEGGTTTYQVPVQLTVRNFSLPDVPSSKTMLDMGYTDIANRYTGVAYPNQGTTAYTNTNLVRSRTVQMMHRHRISVIDSNSGTPNAAGPDAPSQEWIPRLDGTLFTNTNGYRGPGESVGNGIFSIGTYGTWSWNTGTQADMCTNTNNWENWFAANSPQTETFLYLADESANYTQMEQWATWMNTNPGTGKAIQSMATIAAPTAVANVPDLNVITSFIEVGDTTTWQNAVNKILSNPNQRYFMYNGKHPASGSFMIDDDGVYLREIPWGAYKKGIQRWFYWSSDYYNDYQSGRGQTNVWETAQTFGPAGTYNNVLGYTSNTYSNGDGVLFYPGTDTLFPADSLGIMGPVASLRIKIWRRGIQDIDYVTMAAAINPTATQTIVNNMVTSVLWENGVDTLSDPTYRHCPIGWSNDPNTWETARKQLANIIETGSP
jgi:hypothetical protein